MKEKNRQPSASISEQMLSIERDLQRIEQQLVALQLKYQSVAEKRTSLERAVQQLRAEGIAADGSLTWATVCRLKRWPTGGNAHSMVKRKHLGLHVLLHQVAFGETCALDHATYPLP